MNANEIARELEIRFPIANKLAADIAAYVEELLVKQEQQRKEASNG